MKDWKRGVELCNGNNCVQSEVYGYVPENRWHIAENASDVKDNTSSLSLQHSFA